jgi:hypothetical protein
MNKYKFEYSAEAWTDDGPVYRGASKIIYEGCGEDIYSIVDDFKDWLKGVGFMPSTIAKIVVED